jgi:hypothetical protein
MTMQHYTLNPAGRAVYRWRGIKQSIVLYGLVLVTVLALANRGDFSRAGLIGLAAGAASGSLIAGLLTWAGVRNLNAQWHTYQLTLDDHQITRHAARVPDVQIEHTQITALEEYPGTGLVVRTADKRTYIFISSWLTNYAEVRAILETWHPLTVKQSPTQLFLRCLGGASIPVLGIAALTLTTTTTQVVVVGTLLIAGAIWLAVRMQRSQLVPRWFKVVGWLMIPLILLIIVQRLALLR